MKQAELIEAAKKAIQGSEAEVARKIEIKSQSLNEFKKGKPIPDRITIRLAKLAGLDPAATVAAIKAEKADDETRETWQELARRAVMAAMIAAVVAGISLPYPADAGVKALNVYYVKSRSRAAPETLQKALIATSPQPRILNTYRPHRLFDLLSKRLNLLQLLARIHRLDPPHLGEQWQALQFGDRNTEFDE